MTDAHLMDAHCIHGVTWWECVTCDAELAELLSDDVLEAYESEPDPLWFDG